MQQHHNVVSEDTSRSTPLAHPPLRKMKATVARRRQGAPSAHGLHMLLSMAWCCITAQWLAGSQSVAGTEIVGVGDFVSTEECYPPLLSSDINMDRELNATEFIDFMNVLGDGIYVLPLDIAQAPTDVNVTFAYLSCLCISFGEPMSCCDEGVRHIPNGGAGPGEIPNNDQELYLYEICVEAFVLKERLRQDLVPTLSPTPLPSDGPTNLPTFLPSAQPTLSPSFVPTAVPTVAPTDAPVVTSRPTVSPTTPFPSYPPSSSPTASPTVDPSASPTTLPSQNPSMAPSIMPSIAPTNSPVAPPTATPTIPPSFGPTNTLEPTGAPLDTPVIPPSAAPTGAPSIQPVSTPTDAPSSDLPTELPVTLEPTSAPAVAEPTSVPSTLPPSLPPTSGPTVAPSDSPAPTTLTPKPTTSPAPTDSPPLIVPLPFFISNNGNFDSGAIMTGAGNTIRQDLASASTLMAQEIVQAGQLGGRVRRELQLRRRSELVVASAAMASDTLRKLQVTFDVQNNGATIDEVDDGSCPPVDAVPEGSICQNVTAGAPLFIDDSDDADVVGSDFSTAFDEAVADGRLYGKLIQVNPNTPVDFIGSLSAVSAPPDEPVSAPETATVGSDGLGIGAIIAIAAVALGVSAATGLFLRQRSQQKREDDLENGAAADMDDEFGPSSVLGSRQSSTEIPDDIRNFGANRDRNREAELLGATTPNYGRRKEPELLPVPSLATLDADDIGHRDDREAEDLSTSSPAGSSGWSSNKSGVSSLQTYEDDKDLPAPALKELGAASGVASRLDEKNRVSLIGLEDAPISIEGSEHDLSAVHDNDLDSVPSLPSVSRADLDSAIEAGDWAAVGATAAMLARASDQPSFHSRASSSEGMSRGTSVSSMDAQRAAELDHLVDNGDWEGVVLAAQKFEAAGSASRSNTSGARTNPSEPSAGGGAENAAVDMSHSSEAPEEPSRSSTDRSTGTSSAYTPSASTSVSESASKAQKRAEVRSEIEALVRRVVPEEIEHIDEMMRQFQGREEELVETLRTMQERSIAQRARAAVHKTAKREARKARSEANLIKTIGPTQPPAEAGAALPPRPAATADANRGESGGETTANLKTGDDEDENANAEAPFDGRTPSMRKLDNALDAGDWEAVGAAAGMLDDASVTTMSSDEAQELNENEESSADDAKESQDFDGGVSAARAAEVGKLIDLGDWEGVVQAASELTTKEAQDTRSPPTVATPPAGESSDGGETSPSTQQPGEISSRARLKPVPRKDKPRTVSAEEQDALAQAEMWRAIAEQSKQEGSHTAKGASDAAEWAISRSLSVLQSAEQKGQLASGSSGQLDVDSMADSVDTSRGDKSV